MEDSANHAPATRKLLRERAVERAMTDGRSAQEELKSDWDQARREMRGELDDCPDPTQRDTEHPPSPAYFRLLNPTTK